MVRRTHASQSRAARGSRFGRAADQDLSAFSESGSATDQRAPCLQKQASFFPISLLQFGPQERRQMAFRSRDQRDTSNHRLSIRNGLSFKRSETSYAGIEIAPRNGRRYLPARCKQTDVHLTRNYGDGALRSLPRPVRVSTSGSWFASRGSSKVRWCAKTYQAA